ncbi:MAG: DUF2207 domain-containing protein [Endomicrobium sp.]|jgi:uncharacterized membrane protein YgcG|nr:DUF2207 domain-containing protein [Endomicrobium sp.]
MKKLFLLLFSSAFIFICISIIYAEEIIYDFASSISVQKDGSAIVQEVITVNVEHIQIRRGLYRDIPNFASEPVKFISLYMDNQPHPSFTERRGHSLIINFGDDSYISKGIHTYQLTYSIANIVKGFDDYDEVYWNVTGNDWNFTIKHASFYISFPEEAGIKDNLISIYTGKKGSKESNAVKTGKNFFETTKPLHKGEGFTIAVPFEKGIVQSHKKNTEISFFIISAGIILCIILIVYLILSWLAVGKDPNDVIVTEFSPPKNISPAFIRCLWNRKTDKKMFATALVSLAMKNKIEISEEKNFLKKTVMLKLKDKNTIGLPEEEKAVIQTLFYKSSDFHISSLNWHTLSMCMSYIETNFKNRMQKYIASNRKYIFPAVIILILLQLLFVLLGENMPIFIFMNVHYSIFMLVFVNLPKNKIFKAIVFIVINSVYSVFFLSIGKDAGITALAVQGCFLLSFWGLLIYVNIIDNLTPQGRELFKHIKGFYRYMTIAEEHRVALSVPVDDERIFADYMPYALAFDMENKWMKRFEKVLSQATIDRYMQNIGGRKALMNGLIVSSINSAAPRKNGSGSGSGGYSGGGGGGGGGGGR